MFNVSIPNISKKYLRKYAKRIRPIVEVEGTKYYLRKFSMEELTSISYLWEVEENKKKPADMRMYIPHNEMQCIHSYGYYGIFKPCIAEIIAQIPKEDIDFVDAFEIVEYPKMIEDTYLSSIIFDNGFHISTVRLYTSRYNKHVIFSE